QMLAGQGPPQGSLREEAEQARSAPSQPQPEDRQMNRPKRTALSLALALCGIFLAAAPAQAAFGLHDADFTFADSGGTTSMQAGSHPFAWTTTLNVNVAGEGPDGGAVKDLVFELPPGLVVNPTAVPRCSAADFLARDAFGLPGCPAASVVGI